MIEVDVNSTDARDRRRTWMLGGGLLAASALLSLWAASVPGLPAGMVPDLLFAAGAVVFAVGLGRAGSVTARRPLGTSAIIALAVWRLVAPLLQQLVAPSDPAGADWNARAQLFGMIGITVEAVSLALALLAVSQIGRTGVVPRPWNWAPLWALAVVVAMRLLTLGMLFAPMLLDAPDALNAILSLAGFLSICAVGFLGVLAMVLASRPSAGSTTIYGSAESGLSSEQ